MSGARPQPWGDAKPQDLSLIKELPRLRVEYRKDDRLAYLGHLEVLETVSRCIRRAQLPFSVGNGFARRMRIQFSQALPVGASSDCEYFDLRLSEDIGPEAALERLRAVTPSALSPSRAAYVDGRAPALESWLTRSRWEVLVKDCSLGPERLASRIADLKRAGDLEYLRGEKVKHIDVASALVSFEASGAEGGTALLLDTRSSNAGALRPQILIDAALRLAGEGAGYDCLKVRRVSQAHEAEDGSLVLPL
ncbi:TIGR03936 family radical SAM-associated protein [Paratractidigestivibacter sp.]|uniref:TIGR03936 family radical SAM-associated protein n=1 Tax=Paratractidigestivibacter sp. TaxID=2847316 RepID=UPI002ABE0EBE|nr:TIGR03936 family radical SAM-associated protein [Paratractidigestivibacter sp.]